MYKLPNGAIIDEEKVKKAMCNLLPQHFYYLDSVTGKVKFATSRAKKKLPTGRYFKIPHILIDNFEEWSREYTDEFINFEDPEFAIKVYYLLNGKHTYRQFKRLLETSEEDWIHGWVQFEFDSICLKLQDWLFGLPIEIEEETDWFDDCPICQEMKRAEKEKRSLTETELKSAFTKVHDQGGVVGSISPDDSKVLN